MVSSSISAAQPVAYKRSVRNYLLDSRFQLKYTGIVVGVAVIISGIMGCVLYATTRAVISESTALVSESRKVSEVSRMNVRDLAADSPELMTEFNREAEAHDKLISAQQASLLHHQRSVIVTLLGGLALFVLLVGLVGIYFTHKVAGPVHKMKRLLKQVGTGDLHVDARLRRGDELKDFFDAFTDMVANLRAFEAAQLEQIEHAVEALDRGATEDAAVPLKRVRDTMKQGLRL